MFQPLPYDITLQITASLGRKFKQDKIIWTKRL